uniref:Putative lipocal-1 1 n=1 Tax=Amblyomma triste TaxID=251400 RepID=A0A023GB00_AMBTT
MLLSASLFTLTVAIVGVSVDGYPDWANEKRFGKFQDAWTSIGQDPSVIYYLARTDYKDDVGSWGEGFKCVAVRETNKNDEEKSVMSHFFYKNKQTPEGEVNEVTEKVTAIKEYGYQDVYNAIQYHLENGNTLNDTLVFSDGVSCDLFQVPYANSGAGGFELWVNGENIRNIPKYCDFLFKYFSKKEEEFTIYNEDDCKDVVEHVNASKEPHA